MSEYTDRQDKANREKAVIEVALTAAGEKLIEMEASRLAATADKKACEGETVVIKKVSLLLTMQYNYMLYYNTYASQNYEHRYS